MWAEEVLVSNAALCGFLEKESAFGCWGKDTKCILAFFLGLPKLVVSTGLTTIFLVIFESLQIQLVVLCHNVFLLTKCVLFDEPSHR
jgi:hypothetical protein